MTAKRGKICLLYPYSGLFWQKNLNGEKTIYLNFYTNPLTNKRY